MIASIEIVIDALSRLNDSQPLILQIAQLVVSVRDLVEGFENATFKFFFESG